MSYTIQDRPAGFSGKIPRMQMIGRSCLAALLAVLELWAEAPAVPLKPEGRTTLHVGQVAVLHTPPNHQYGVTSEGEAIVAVEQARNNKGSYFYRAVRPGYATLIVTPADLKQGDCVSCVTQHFFVTVIRDQRMSANATSDETRLCNRGCRNLASVVGSAILPTSCTRPEQRRGRAEDFPFPSQSYPVQGHGHFLCSFSSLSGGVADNP